MELTILATVMMMSDRILICRTYKSLGCIPGVSNSNCSVGQMRTCMVTRGPHYDADETIAVPELTKNSFYIFFPAKGIMNYRQIISSRLYVRINQF